MSDINSVRKALSDLYEFYYANGGDRSGKSSEGVITVSYPGHNDECPANTPYSISIYSYELGPSRNHLVVYDEREDTRDSTNWKGPDVFVLAERMIDSWKKRLIDELLERNDQ
jgi:hypothetical protein